MHRWFVFSVGFVAACVGDGDTASDLAAVEQIVVVSEFDFFVPAGTAAPSQLRDAQGALLAPVHASVLPDGRVHLIGVGGNAGILTPTPADQAPPAIVTLAAATPPVEVPPGTLFGSWRVGDSLFCSGHTILADGGLLTIGGTRFVEDLSVAVPPGQAPPTTLLGLAYATRYDGRGWRRIADRMKGQGPSGETWRWYGQATRLGDGRVLVLGGYDYVGTIVNGEFVLDPPPGHNVTAELFDPATETFSLVTDSAQTPPEIFNGDYTHAFVLPYAGLGIDVMAFGWPSMPAFLSVGARGWSVTRKPRPGAPVVAGGGTIGRPNDGVSMAMLMLRLVNGEWGYFNGAVAAAGGEHGTVMEHHVDVYDPVIEAWSRHLDLEARRHHPSTVLLPDGKLLVIAGHDDANPGNPEVRRALYVDPKAGFRVRGGISQMTEVRGYHTVTALLPDGRVLVGGGRSGGPLAGANERADFRYFYPPYMFRARPVLALAPTALGYGETVTIAASAGVTEAVLMALPSMTHSFDSNQRGIQVPIRPRAGAVGLYDLVGPANAQLAPTGYYMLFVLDASGTPSVAKMIHVR